MSFNDEAEQYLCAAVLRPGNVTATVGARGILRRLLLMICHCFPGARIRVRLDGGFAHPDLLDFLDGEPNLEYVIAMAKNAVLGRSNTSTAKPPMRPEPGRNNPYHHLNVTNDEELTELAQETNSREHPAAALVVFTDLEGPFQTQHRTIQSCGRPPKDHPAPFGEVIPMAAA